MVAEGYRYNQRYKVAVSGTPFICVEKEIMADYRIPGPLAERLRAIAEQEQRSVEEVLSDMISQYQPRPEDSPVVRPTSVADALATREGMFDANMTALSTYMKKAIEDYFKDQDDDSE